MFTRLRPQSGSALPRMAHILDFFRSNFSAFWLGEPKRTEIGSEKVQDVSYSGLILSTFGPNLVILQPVLCSPESGCGGKFFGSEGVISSPNYPDNYVTSTTCVYVITVGLNFRVQLTFEDFQTGFCDDVKVRSSSDNVRFGVSDLDPNWVRLAQQGTNPGLFEIRFQYILKKSRICSIVDQYDQHW